MSTKSGSSSTIVGYKYYMSMHEGICRGTCNELIEIKVGDRTAWNYITDNAGLPVTDNQYVDINKPNLFGGDEKEGGIVGRLLALFGRSDQVVPDLIKNALPGLVPDWRGVMSLFYYGIVAVNNPYPKAWKMRVRRSTAGWDNDTVWYAEKCKIIMSQQNTLLLTVVTNPTDGNYVILGGVTIEFADPPETNKVTIGADSGATAQNFANAVNLHSADLFDANAVASGDTVSLTFPGGAVSATSSGVNLTIEFPDDIHAMNPAHIIYQAATDRSWGRGLPASFLNDTAFREFADQLYDEGLGLCIRWNRQEDLDKFVDTVLNHVGGVIYTDLNTGLLTPKLIRDDYVVDNLAVFNFESGLLDIIDDQSIATDTNYNEIVVTYHDPVTDTDGQIRAQDLAAIQSLGTTISTQVSYIGVPTPELAARLAQRDLQIQSVELRRLTVKLDRAGRLIAPGGVFRIRAPSRGISEIVLRAGKVEDSPLGDGTITITGIQDIFSFPDVAFVSPQYSAWIPPDFSARVVEVRRIEEFNYRDLAGNLTTADLNAIEPDSGAIKTFAKRPSDQSQDYLVSTAVGSEEFVSRGANSWEPTTTLAAAIGHYDVDLTFDLDNLFVGDELNQVAIGDTVLIDDELMAVDAIDVTLGTLTVRRGVVDTIPDAHDIGARLWFEVARPAGDGREYTTSEVVHVKLLTRTSSNVLSESLAPTDDITIGGRQGRPYPPGNMQINGDPWADVTEVDNGDIDFTWAHRDRISEGDFLLEHEAGSTGPEAGTTYNVRVYDGVTLIRTETGITDDFWTYDAAMSTTDGDIHTLTFEIESERDGFVSWQKYHFTVSRPEGFDDGFDDNFDGGV